MNRLTELQHEIMTCTEEYIKIQTQIAVLQCELLRNVTKTAKLRTEKKKLIVIAPEPPDLHHSGGITKPFDASEEWGTRETAWGDREM